MGKCRKRRYTISQLIAMPLEEYSDMLKQWPDGFDRNALKEAPTSRRNEMLALRPKDIDENLNRNVMAEDLENRLFLLETGRVARIR